MFYEVTDKNCNKIALKEGIIIEIIDKNWKIGSIEIADNLPINSIKLIIKKKEAE